MEARKSDDQAFRKATYKKACPTSSTGPFIPIYQRQNCIIFSAERVKLDTVTPTSPRSGTGTKTSRMEMVVDTTQV